QLIMNEMQVKIRKNKLPSISNTYDSDVATSYDYIHKMEKLINETPMNIERLNKVSTEAIDYIYKLYNNVNKVVGMAVMVENAIVFGNKYRSTYGDIDSALTHAELCYRNGEYTQALTIAIETIEKIHPGSYESLIRENAENE
ncbi:MAG: selenide, water dikinase, partial [Erysipelotrichaceae bacterium]|nr:selenide, water dikinase [Erysipelotrichaceae bacterium]